MAGIAGRLTGGRGWSGLTSRRRRGRRTSRRCRVRGGTVEAVEYDGENGCAEDGSQRDGTGTHAPDAQLHHRVRLFGFLGRQFSREYFLVGRAVVRWCRITRAIVPIGCVSHLSRSLASTVASSAIPAARAGSLQTRSTASSCTKSSRAKKAARFVPLKTDRRAGGGMRLNEGLMGGEPIETIPPKSARFLNFHSSRLHKLGCRRQSLSAPQVAARW
jgi:hypothetical protein